MVGAGHGADELDQDITILLDGLTTHLHPTNPGTPEGRPGFTKPLDP